MEKSGSAHRRCGQFKFSGFMRRDIYVSPAITEPYLRVVVKFMPCAMRARVLLRAFFHATCNLFGESHLFAAAPVTAVTRFISLKI